MILSHAGEVERAIDYGERALRFSPADFMTYLPNAGLALAHYVAGHFSEAALAGARAAQANPRFSYPQVLQTAALAQSSRLEEAKAVARRVLELEPNFSVAAFTRAHTGRADIWDPIGEVLRRIGLPE